MSTLLSALSEEDIRLGQDVGLLKKDEVSQDQKPELNPELNQDAAPDIFANAILLKLDMGKLGTNKKLKTSLIIVDADKDRISAAKSILESPQLRAIHKEMSLISKKINNICLPSMFKRGIYLLPIASISDVDQLLTEAQAAILGQLVPAFLEVYPQLVEDDKLSLRGGTYNPADYPPVDKVASEFYFDWSYVSVGVPPKLSSVNSDLFIREQQKAAARLTEAVDDIRGLLRAQMLELVEHLSEQMTGTSSKNGKPKSIKTASVVNLKSFLDSFSARNITEDAELDKLCDQAKSLLDGVDPQALRDSAQTKDKVVAGFQEIKASLDTLMVDKPSRMIRFAAKPEPKPEPEA